MNLQRSLILPILILIGIFSAKSVTDSEMRRAEAITAVQYLRWANDASGYLDNYKDVATLAELEGKLKPKEKENLQAFKAVSKPANYASWDKDALVKYWSNTFFESKGLSDAGRRARSIVSREIRKLDIAPVTAQSSEPSAQQGVISTENSDSAALAADRKLAEEQAMLQQQADSIAEAQAALEEQPQKKEANLTPVYVGVLCALICVVIFLVIYASRTMKDSGNNSRNNSGKATNRTKENIPHSSAGNYGNEMESLRQGNERLRKQNMEIENENRRLHDENEQLRQETYNLKSRISSCESEMERMKQQSAASSQPQTPVQAPRKPAPRRAVRPAATESAADNAANNSAVIYLGRVNRDGLFVRADRKPAPGHTIFLLRTDDGFTGSFRVVNNPEVWDLCLNDPDKYLLGGAEGDNLDDTAGYSRVVSHQAGTAIFENGCWRVLRKAIVSYS